MMNDAPTSAPADSEAGSEAGSFYILEADYQGDGPFYGLDFVNKSKLLAGRAILRPLRGGFRKLPELPMLVHNPEKGTLPRDFESGISGYRLVSERLKSALEAIDPAGVSFHPCDFRLANGTAGPYYYLCDFIRTLDALDEERSVVRIEIDADFVNGKHYGIGPGARLVFKHSIVEQARAHIFYTPYSPYVFCDQALRDAIVAERFTGLLFSDAADF